jgi:hypothetical protein
MLEVVYVVCVMLKASKALGLDDNAYNRQAPSRMRIVTIFNMKINRE